MDRLQTAIAALHEVDIESGAYGAESSVHPLARLIVCMGFSVFAHNRDLGGDPHREEPVRTAVSFLSCLFPGAGQFVL